MPNGASRDRQGSMGSSVSATRGISVGVEIHRKRRRKLK